MDELIKELKRQGVLKSSRVEAAFRAIDRADFVRPGHEREAYANHPLPIGKGQTISQPYTVAFLLDLLDPRPGEKIIDIGAGSGWTTALLAYVVSSEQEPVNKKRAGNVFAVERIPELCAFGRANVRKYGYIKKRVVKFLCQDGTGGLPEHAPFDKILASATASRDIPAAWREELAVGGSIVAPVDGAIRQYRKIAPGQWEEREYPGFAFVPLVHEAPRTPLERARARDDVNGTRATRQNRRLRPRPLPKAGDRNASHGGAFNFIVAVLAVALSFFYVILVPVRPGAERTRLIIPPGSGSRAIGELLQSQGIIRSKWAFVTYAAFTGEAGALKPGIYALGERVSIPSLVQTLVRGGQDPNERFITIPEGWDQRHIAAYFEREGLFSAGQWWAASGLPAHDYRGDREHPPLEDFRGEFTSLAGKPEFIGLEGYLYPDTYRVFRDATPADVLRAMLSNFGEKLDRELREEIVRQGRTVFEIVTMASLLEQESPNDADRKIIAGILWKRLSRGMPLQVDATVNYVTGRRATPSAADLAVNSPYNTYRAPGLPLGPIANPGIAAIRAAVRPEPSEYFYYLSSPSGETIFSRTLAEHAAAKNRYLRSSAPPVAE